MKKVIFLVVKRIIKVPRYILLAALVSGTLGWGCATTNPSVAISDAQEAIEQAQKVQAQRYAAKTLKSAEEALDKAQTYLGQREYERALELALESERKAKKAEEEALRARDKFKKEVLKSLEETEKTLTLQEKEQKDYLSAKNLKLARETFKRANLAFDSKRYEEAGDLALLAKNQALGIMEAVKPAGKEDTRKEKRSIEALNQGIAIYKVKPGETLWMIAGYAEIYDDSLLWPIIYKANRDQIRDPEVIFTEQSLKIPRNITEEQRNLAIKEASEGTWFKHDTIKDKESYLLKRP